jgi:hypothetical protein
MHACAQRHSVTSQQRHSACGCAGAELKACARPALHVLVDFKAVLGELLAKSSQQRALQELSHSISTVLYAIFSHMAEDAAPSLPHSPRLLPEQQSVALFAVLLKVRVQGCL